jgi:hypothetical protein
VIPFLLVIVVIIAVGAGVLAYRARPESSIESGVRAFRREMRALAPPPDHRRGSNEGPHDGSGTRSDSPPQDVP